MSFQSILLFLHSWVRWLLLIAAAGALVKHVLGLVQRTEYDRLSRILMSAFSGLMDLNVLIGIIQLATTWNQYSIISESLGGPSFPMTQIEHATTMLIAAAVSHLPSILWKDKEDAVRYRNTTIALVVALALIVFAILPLEGSRWVFRGLGG